FLLLLIPLPAGAAGRAEAACGGTAPGITVTTVEQRMRLDQALSIADLSGRAGGESPDAYALGLTESKGSAATRYEFLISPEGGGVSCAAFRSITVTLQLAMTVHIGSGLKPGSCLYNAALQHEQGHVVVERQMLPRTRARVDVVLTGVQRAETASDAAVA